MRATVFLFVMSLSTGILSGGWTQPAGGGYAKIWLRWQAADGFLNGHHDPGNNRKPIGNYNEVFLNSYAEYGFSDRLTGVLFWPFLTGFFMSDVNDFSYIGTGDPSVGMRVGLVQRRWVISLQVLGTVPLADADLRHPFFDTETGARLGELRVGAGTWDVAPRLQAGVGWADGHIGVEAGYRFRSKGYHTVFSAGGEVGYRLHPAVYGTVRVVEVRPVGRTSAPLDNSPSGIGNGTKYFGFSAELDWRRGDHWSLGVVGEGALYYSRQAGGPVFSVYAAWQW